MLKHLMKIAARFQHHGRGLRENRRLAVRVVLNVAVHDLENDVEERREQIRKLFAEHLRHNRLKLLARLVRQLSKDLQRRYTSKQQSNPENKGNRKKPFNKGFLSAESSTIDNTIKHLSNNGGFCCGKPK